MPTTSATTATTATTAARTAPGTPSIRRPVPVRITARIQRITCPGSRPASQRADHDPGQRPDDERQRQVHAHLAEEHMAECRDRNQRDGLGEVGTHQLLCRQVRVDEQQPDDDDRPRADRGETHDRPTEQSDHQGEQGPRPDQGRRWGRAGGSRPPAAGDDRLDDHAGHPEQERSADRGLQPGLDGRSRPEKGLEIGAGKCRRERGGQQQGHQVPAHPAGSLVHERPHRFHRERHHQVAADRGGGGHIETEHQ